MWMCHGRVVFGVGRGYHTREVETFGSPMLDAEANLDAISIAQSMIDEIMCRSRHVVVLHCSTYAKPLPFAEQLQGS